jgi:hypothetical protein
MATRADTHEHFTGLTEIRGSSDRGFGLVLGAVLLLAGLAPLRRGGSVRMWALAVALAFLVPAVVRPSLLHPLNRLWTALGLLLGRIVNPIVTSVLFFVVFTPGAILMRLLGKDLLGLRDGEDRTSYWSKRQSPGPEPESMVNQF